MKPWTSLHYKPLQIPHTSFLVYILTLSCVFLKEQWHILPLQFYQRMYERLQTHWHDLPTSKLPVKEHFLQHYNFKEALYYII
jgi:hypothetical protein